MKFAFIAKHRHAWPVSWLCETLNISRSGFHAWLSRPASVHAIVDEQLGEAIGQSFQRSDRNYGARRIWHDVLAESLPRGLHRVERLMRLHGLRARPRRRGLPKDDGTRSIIADNILDRNFQAKRPNQKWLADFTYVWTAEGWLYVAAVLDSSRSEAEAAAQHIARTWDEPIPATNMKVFRTQSGQPLDLEAFKAPPLRPSLQDRTGAEATIGVAGDGPYVAWVALRGMPEGDGQRIRNTAFEALWIGVIQRDLTLFGPM